MATECIVDKDRHRRLPPFYRFAAAWASGDEGTASGESSAYTLASVGSGGSSRLVHCLNLGSLQMAPLLQPNALNPLHLTASNDIGNERPGITYKAPFLLQLQVATDGGA